MRVENACLLILISFFNINVIESMGLEDWNRNTHDVEATFFDDYDSHYAYERGQKRVRNNGHVSRRIGIAEEYDEIHEQPNTSQPDISDMVGTTADARRNRIAERMKELRNRFPKLRNRSKFGLKANGSEETDVEKKYPEESDRTNTSKTDVVATESRLIEVPSREIILDNDKLQKRRPNYPNKKIRSHMNFNQRQRRRKQGQSSNKNRTKPIKKNLRKFRGGLKNKFGARLKYSEDNEDNLSDNESHRGDMLQSNNETLTNPESTDGHSSVKEYNKVAGRNETNEDHGLRKVNEETPDISFDGNKFYEDSNKRYPNENKASDNLDIIDESSKKKIDDISEDRTHNYNSGFSRTIPKEYVERKSNSIEDAPIEQPSFKVEHEEILNEYSTESSRDQNTYNFNDDTKQNHNSFNIFSTESPHDSGRSFTPNIDNKQNNKRYTSIPNRNRNDVNSREYSTESSRDQNKYNFNDDTKQNHNSFNIFSTESPQESGRSFSPNIDYKHNNKRYTSIPNRNRNDINSRDHLLINSKTSSAPDYPLENSRTTVQSDEYFEKSRKYVTSDETLRNFNVGSTPDDSFSGSYKSSPSEPRFDKNRQFSTSGQLYNKNRFSSRPSTTIDDSYVPLFKKSPDANYRYNGDQKQDRPMSTSHAKVNMGVDKSERNSIEFDPSSFWPDHDKFMTTTERILMEPTKVPGSSHLVTRDNFPYNFWTPSGDGSSDRSDTNNENNYGSGNEVRKHVPMPDHLFSVGAGPVSVPEELVVKSYHTVTAAPSFDLTHNPFDGEDDIFNALPQANEIEVHIQGNRRNLSPVPPRRPNFGRPRPSSPFKRMSHGPPPPRFKSNMPHNRPSRPNMFRPSHRKQSPNNMHGSLERELDENLLNSFPRDKFEVTRPIPDRSIGHSNRNNNHPVRPRLVEGPMRRIRTRPPPPRYVRHEPQGSHPNSRDTRSREPSRTHRDTRNRKPTSGPVRPHPTTRNTQQHEPDWIRKETNDLSLFENPFIKPIDPHTSFTTGQPFVDQTRSHFEVKQADILAQKSDVTPYSDRRGLENNGEHGRNSNNLRRREFHPDNRFIPNRPIPYPSRPEVQEYDRNRPVHNPHFVNHELQRYPHNRPPLDPHRMVTEDDESPSFWDRLADFDLSFLNPFSDDNNVDRVAGTGLAASSMLVPGGLAILAAGLSAFYFNYGWLVNTPVVKARLMNSVMKTLNFESLSDDQQSAIGNVAKIYEALSAMSDEFADLKDKNSDEPLMNLDCRSRMVCQAYSEFDDLLDITKGAATLLRGVLTGLDEDLLLEYFLAADRGHHVTAQGQQCRDFYPECPMPEVSIKTSLMNLVAIEDKGNAIDEKASEPANQESE